MLEKLLEPLKTIREFMHTVHDHIPGAGAKHLIDKMDEHVAGLEGEIKAGQAEELADHSAETLNAAEAEKHTADTSADDLNAQEAAKHRQFYDVQAPGDDPA